MKKVFIQVYFEELLKHYKRVEDSPELLKAQCEEIYRRTCSITHNLNCMILSQCLKETLSLHGLLSNLIVTNHFEKQPIEEKLARDCKKVTDFKFDGTAESYQKTVNLILILNEKRDDHTRSKGVLSL